MPKMQLFSNVDLVWIYVDVGYQLQTEDFFEKYWKYLQRLLTKSLILSSWPAMKLIATFPGSNLNMNFVA